LLVTVVQHVSDAVGAAPSYRNGPGTVVAEHTSMHAPRDRAQETAQAMFQQAWRIYRIVVDENYLFHREAYACLHQVLRQEMSRPFRFLDLACGDATPSLDALRGTAIAHYYGLDLSAAALDLARQTLEVLGCPVTLEQGDLVERLPTWTEPVDVVWIGLGLHHMSTSEKRVVMGTVRNLLPEDGLFVIYEDTSPDGEAREAWLQRWDDQKPLWTAYSQEEWDVITGHVHEADFPESVSSWRRLGHDAGFNAVEERFVAPSDLFRLFTFRP
jgi:ubiquinone/menaquinone biosynthesis C-methylase UbiE